MTRQVYASFGANLALTCRKSLESWLVSVMHDGVQEIEAAGQRLVARAGDLHEYRQAA